MNRIFALAAIAGLSACSPPATPPTVQATGAWCRAAPVGAKAGGCYVTLTASSDDRLIAVDTTDADHGEIHTMEIDGGIMRMRPLPDGIALPAGTPVNLKPGSLHLMIIGPRRILAAGDSVRLTLTFSRAAPVTLAAPIRTAPGPATGASGGGHH